MKKRKRALPELNKSSVWKMFIFVAIIVLVEVAAGLFIFSQFSSRSYKQEYAAIQQKADGVSSKIYQAHSDDINNIESDEALLTAITEECAATGEFEYYIVFSEASGGKIVSGGGLNLSGNLRDNYGLSYNSVGRMEVSGKTYVFAPSALGKSGYRIGGLKDFTEHQKIITNLRGNTVAILIAAGMVITAAFVIYAYLLANKERT
ncbi:MAG: hypothetical protein K2O62_05455, partial [Clostridia bacterium]|nr:hypothetical protein [Clostridia bacterium]